MIKIPHRRDITSPLFPRNLCFQRYVPVNMLDRLPLMKMLFFFPLHPIPLRFSLLHGCLQPDCVLSGKGAERGVLVCGAELASGFYDFLFFVSKKWDVGLTVGLGQVEVMHELRQRLCARLRGSDRHSCDCFGVTLLWWVFEVSGRVEVLVVVGAPRHSCYLWNRSDCFLALVEEFWPWMYVHH